MSLMTEIEDYEDAVTGELLSIFELKLSLMSRDKLYTSSLSPEERDRVDQLDQEFIDRAVEVRNFIATYGDADGIFADKPPQRWWWHLPRIATGKMSVNLQERVVSVDQTKYSY